MAEKKITQSDIMSVYWRSFFDMASINYERFQALPYLFTFQKVFKKLYGDNKERMTRACLRHVEMFNTMPLFIPVIQGTTLALEEKIANTPVEEDTAEELLQETFYQAVRSYVQELLLSYQAFLLFELRGVPFLKHLRGALLIPFRHRYAV